MPPDEDIRTRLRAALAPHVDGDALEAAVSDAAEALVGAPGYGTFTCYSDEEGDWQDLPSVTWSVEASEQALTLDIGRSDGRGEPLSLSFEVRSRMGGRDTAGQVSILVSEGSADSFLGVLLEDRSVRIHDGSRDRADWEMNGQSIRLLGPVGEEWDRQPAAEAAAEGVAEGRFCGDGPAGRWTLEVGDVDGLAMARISGLIACGYVSGADPEWRLDTSPTAHALGAAAARPQIHVPPEFLEPPI